LQSGYSLVLSIKIVQWERGMMSQFTNDKCRWVIIGSGGSYCNKPVWVLPNGIRVDTPYCETHARKWSDSRDLESIMNV
jgi:hypothetical protein